MTDVRNLCWVMELFVRLQERFLAPLDYDAFQVSKIIFGATFEQTKHLLQPFLSIRGYRGLCLQGSLLQSTCLWVILGSYAIQTRLHYFCL